jgi:hypothetical protein
MRFLMLGATLLALLCGCASNHPTSEAPKISRITPEELERLQPVPAPNLPLDEIVRMSKAGATPDLIIAAIRDSHSGYALTASQMMELARQGVDGKVLDHIQGAQEQAMRDAFAEEFNQRERVCEEKIKGLQREVLRSPYYDPFWIYPAPYWSYPLPYGYPYWRRW